MEEVENNNNNELKMESNNPPINNDITDVKPVPVKHTQTPVKTDLCTCPLRCNDKVSKEAREFLNMKFRCLHKHSTQNRYLQKFIVIRSVAKRLWEDEIIDGKIQRRVTCKYFIPELKAPVSYMDQSLQTDVDKNNENNISVANGNDISMSNGNNISVPNGNDISVPNENDISVPNENDVLVPNGIDVSVSNGNGILVPNGNDISVPNGNGIMVPNGDSISVPDRNGISAPSGNEMNDVGSDGIAKIDNRQTKRNGLNKSITFFDDSYDMSTDGDSDTGNEDSIVQNPDTSKISLITIGKIEICQKAFINIYGITEKRIRYLRERLILKSRFFAEKKQKKIEEMERTLSIARNLGAGCQPLFALLETTNTLHLSEQILAAIENDINLVNNFFRNQLWKPENINKDTKCPFENGDSQLTLLAKLSTTKQ